MTDNGDTYKLLYETFDGQLVEPRLRQTTVHDVEGSPDVLLLNDDTELIAPSSIEVLVSIDTTESLSRGTVNSLLLTPRANRFRGGDEQLRGHAAAIRAGGAARQDRGGARTGSGGAAPQEPDESRFIDRELAAGRVHRPCRVHRESHRHVRLEAAARAIGKGHGDLQRVRLLDDPAFADDATDELAAFYNPGSGFIDDPMYPWARQAIGSTSDPSTSRAEQPLPCAPLSRSVA